jgi:large subunit ribosomal protein L23
MSTNKISIFDILICPVLNSKAIRVLEQDQYSFWVNPLADKNSIRIAVEQFFDVEVLSVTTCTRSVRRQGIQAKSFGRSSGRVKRAVVRLAPGSTLSLFNR